MQIPAINIKKYAVLTFVVLSVLSLQAAAEEYKTVKALIDNDSRADVFSNLLRTGMLYKTLITEGPFTVFVFTDNVYKELPVAVQKYLHKAEFEPWRGRILGNHIVQQLIELPYKEFPVEVNTIGGNTLILFKENGEYYINNARLVGKPMFAENGVVMFINAIIVP